MHKTVMIYQPVGVLFDKTKKLIVFMEMHLLQYDKFLPQFSVITNADFRLPNFIVWDHASPYSNELLPSIYHLFLQL